jgi:hypothetical protein
VSKDCVEDVEKTFNEIVRSHLNYTAGSGRYAIAQLSKVVESLKDSKPESKAPALVPISREARRMKLSSLNKETKHE